jgi:hypothetical protein
VRSRTTSGLRARADRGLDFELAGGLVEEQQRGALGGEQFGRVAQDRLVSLLWFGRVDLLGQRLQVVGDAHPPLKLAAQPEEFERHGRAAAVFTQSLARRPVERGVGDDERAPDLAGRNQREEFFARAPVRQ